MPSDIVDQYNPDAQQQQPPQPPLPQQDIEQDKLPSADDGHHSNNTLHTKAPRDLEQNQRPNSHHHQSAEQPATSRPQHSHAAFSLETAALDLNSASQPDVEQWCRHLAACAAHGQQGVDRAGLAARIARKVGAFPPACRDDIAGTCAAQLDAGLRAAICGPPAFVRGHVDAILLLVSAGVVPAFVVLHAAAWLSDDPQGPGVADALVEFTDALTRRSLWELGGAAPLLARGLEATRDHVPRELRALVDLSLGKLRIALSKCTQLRLTHRERYVEECRALCEKGCARHATDGNQYGNAPDRLLRQLLEQVACFGASTVPVGDLARRTGDAAQQDVLWQAAGILEAARIIRRTVLNDVQAVAFAVRDSCDATMAPPMSTRAMLPLLRHVGTDRGSDMNATEQVDEVRAVATAAGLITIAPVDVDAPTPFVASALPRLPLLLSSKAAELAMNSGIRAALSGLRVFSAQAAALTVARLDDALRLLTEPGTRPSTSLKEIAVSAVLAAMPETPRSEVKSSSGDADLTAAASAAVAFIACLDGSLTDLAVDMLLRSNVPPMGTREVRLVYVAMMRKLAFSGLVVAGLVTLGLVTGAVVVKHLRCAYGRAHTVPAYHVYSHALDLASKLDVLYCFRPTDLDAHVAWLENGCRRHNDERSTAYGAVRSALASLNTARLSLHHTSEGPERVLPFNGALAPGSSRRSRRRKARLAAALPT